MKDIAKQLGSSRLSFASGERLQKHLGLEAGQVGPLAVMQNEGHAVIVVLDEDLKGEEKIGIHPNDNTATVWVSFADLERFIKHYGNPVAYIRI